MKDDKNTHLQNEMPSKWKRLLKKRWFYPAVYLGVAAIVIATVLWAQMGSKVAEHEEDATAHDYNEEAVPAAQQQEVFVEPVLANGSEVKTPFYDVNASAEEQESALVFYNNKYHQHQGIDYALKSGEAFDVAAAMSGTVEKAEKDPLLGYVVQLKHSDGVATVYQSLANVNVEEGDEVEQGDIIGEAGKNQFHKDAGVHLHFEIRKDGVAVNPQEYFGKSVSAIPGIEELQEQQEAQNEEAETDTESEGEAKQKDASRSMTNA